MNNNDKSESMNNECDELNQCIKNAFQSRDAGHVAVISFRNDLSGDSEETNSFKSRLKDFENEMKKLLLYYIRIDGRTKCENGEEAEEVSYILLDTQTSRKLGTKDLLLFIRDFYRRYDFSCNGAILWNCASGKVITCFVNADSEPEILSESFLPWPETLPNVWKVLRAMVPGIDCVANSHYELDSYDPHLAHGYSFSTGIAALGRRNFTLKELRENDSIMPCKAVQTYETEGEKVSFDEAFHLPEEGGRCGFLFVQSEDLERTIGLIRSLNYEVLVVRGGRTGIRPFPGHAYREQVLLSVQDPTKAFADLGRFSDIMAGIAALMKARNYLILEGTRADLYSFPHMFDLSKESLHRRVYSQHIVFSPVTPKEAIMLFSKAGCFEKGYTPLSIGWMECVKRFRPFPKDSIMATQYEASDYRGRRSRLLHITE